MNPARFFAVASLSFGLALILLSPPFCTPDEPAHLYRAWSIANGRFFAPRGDSIPISLVDTATTMLHLTRGAETGQITVDRIVALSRIPLRPERVVFVPIPRDIPHEPLGYTAPSYTPVGYAATVAVIAAGRLLRVSPIALMYAGRAANLIVATALIAWAIAIAPFGRWIFALIALTPMAVFMRGSLSIDALTLASALALICALLAARPTTSIILSFVICAIKPGYVLIPLLALAIPQLRKRRGVMMLIIVAAVAGVLMTAIWARSVEAASSDLNARVTTALHHPLRHAARVQHELLTDAKLLTIQAVADFGWLDAPAPLAFALLWVGGLIVVSIIDGSSTLTGAARLYSLLLFLASLFSLVTLIHLGSEGIEFLRGLQGRYLLPLLPLAALALIGTNGTSQAARARLVYGLTALGAAQSVWILICRYWL